jgi:hypothetical protein
MLLYPWTVLLSCTPSIVQAHVKWFVDADHIIRNEAFTFHWTDPAVQVWIGALVFGLVGAYLVDRYVRQPPQVLIDKGAQWHSGIVYLFRLIVGISLILTAYKGAVLAPHLKEGTTFALALRGVEALIGVLFISNRLVFFGAGLLFLLFFASTAVFGFLMSLEYFNLLGIAIFLLFIKAPKRSWLDRHCIWALPLLRLHTGVALSVLAFSEKLLQPSLAMAFLAKHDVNFMKTLGFDNFTDHLFVLSAGCSELLFGMIFILGLVTRINTVSLASFLIASNVYFFLLGKQAEGILEIIGHANIFAIGMLLIFYGAGSKIRLSTRHQNACESEANPERRQIPVDASRCEPWCGDYVAAPRIAIAGSANPHA